MLAGPKAEKVTRILASRIPENDAGEIIEKILQDPHEDNLALVGMLFDFSDAELKEIRALRGFETQLPASDSPATDELAAPSLPFLEEMTQGWDRLVQAKNYKRKIVHDYLTCCRAVCASSINLGQYPGLPMTIGFGVRVARLERGLTQKEVQEQYGFSIPTLRAVEWGHPNNRANKKTSKYLDQLFTGGARVDVQAIELLLSNTRYYRDFFNHLGNDLFLKVDMAKKR